MALRPALVHAGEALEPVDTPAGRLGVFVCADGRIPTIASTLVARGARDPGRSDRLGDAAAATPHALENLQADLMIPVRARENGVPLVVANKVGVEARSVAYCGKSQIVAADGTVVALAPQDEATTLTATVAIGPPIVDARRRSRRRSRGSPARRCPTSLRIAIALRADPELHALGGASPTPSW